MIPSRLATSSESVLRADICIVGSGPSGQAVARTLAGTADVLVVEAGHIEPSDDVRWGRRYASAAMPSVGRQYPNAGHHVSIRPGGTSDRWSVRIDPETTSGSAVRIHRLDAVDFVERPTPGAEGWPITVDALEPFYHRAESMFGLGPNQTCDTTVLDSSPHLESKVFWAVDRACFSLPDLGPSRVVTGCVVTKLVAGPDGRITTAHAITRRREAVRIEADVFVLAMGAVQTTRLLLDSPWSEAESIANSSGRLGWYLTDHPQLILGQLVLRKGADLDALAHLCPSTEDGGTGTVLRWPNLGTSATRSQSPDVARIAATILPVPRFPRTQRLRNHYRRPQGTRTGALKIASEVADSVRQGRADWSTLKRAPLMLGGIDEILRARFAARVQRPTWVVESPHWSQLVGSDQLAGFQIFAIAEQLPHPENRIVLSPETNGHGGCRARIEWRWTNDDQRRVESTADDVRSYLDRLGVGSVIPRVGKASIMKITSHHASGTARMSDRPELGVVDTELRTHDHPNLYIVGSAVFDTAGYANPTLTDVALGIRLGDHLRGLC
jgi:choline dehydrogenase-like flavoprotein